MSSNNENINKRKSCEWSHPILLLKKIILIIGKYNTIFRTLKIVIFLTCAENEIFMRHKAKLSACIRMRKKSLPALIVRNFFPAVKKFKK